MAFFLSKTVGFKKSAIKVDPGFQVFDREKFILRVCLGNFSRPASDRWDAADSEPPGITEPRGRRQL